MEKKFVAIQNFDFDSFFEYDEYFVMALSMAYMVLSKEKIIGKDKKDDDILRRLKPKVDVAEIDKVFAPGFASSEVQINSSLSENSVWILDCLRDSIAHSQFDVDEENKQILINNAGDRELKANVPFSWFVQYIKNNILSKKEANNHFVRGFYYDKDKSNKDQFDVKKELISHIFYKVYISGAKFNVNKIENRIRELFMIYSKDDLSDEMVMKFDEEFGNRKFGFSKEYLVSFEIAKKKVMEVIKEEFPGVDIRINIVDVLKSGFADSMISSMPSNVSNYDALFNVLNVAYNSNSSTSLLNIMVRIFENIGAVQSLNITDSSDISSLKNNVILLHSIITGEKLNGDSLDINDLKTLQSFYTNILKVICISVYGLTTLSINHGTLYDSEFLAKNPSDFGLVAYLKNPYLEYLRKLDVIVKNDMEVLKVLKQYREQLKRCKDPARKDVIEKNIEKLLEKRNKLRVEKRNIKEIIKLDSIVMGDNEDKKEEEYVKELIKRSGESFLRADKGKEGKNKTVMFKLLEVLNEKKGDYMATNCRDMYTVLTAIRNCFAHIGRIKIGNDSGADTVVKLIDYDDDGSKSGEIMCSFRDLVDLLSNPYVIKADKNK